MADGVVAVLFAQVRDDWKSFVPAINLKTLVGWWNQYYSLIEVVDTKQHRVLSSAHFPGYPRRILDDQHVATWVEEPGGAKSVDVWTIRLKP